MSSAEFGWQSLLATDAPAGSRLQAALFTTYDRADERLLVEHLLPALLNLNHEPESEGVERQYFLVELDRHLKQLHDRLVVVSSRVREEPGDSEKSESEAYGWIGRYISHLTVGRHAKAVQHAKLWMLHWGPDTDGGEHLEIVVSSANLTLAAFKGQLQAAWRACIKLSPERSEERLKRWGVLPDFLRELAASAGEDGRLNLFIELLERGDCPDGVTFVASVPGRHSLQEPRHTPWGAAGLREIRPAGGGAVSAAILCPFVGSWTADGLQRWCASFEGLPDRLALVWIDENHPWARDGKWLLPASTWKTLAEAGAALLHLCYEADDFNGTDVFHEEHRPQDPRWSHAKVYLFKRGNSRRLLLTSANFSAAAWGRQNDNGELTIENFELGVCVEQAVWPFDNLDPFESAQDAYTVSELLSYGPSLIIVWWRAVWDGKRIAVDCRCESKGNLKGEIKSGGEWTPIPSWTMGAGNLRSARVPWADSKRPPLLVQLTCEHETVSVPVFDDRPAPDRDGDIPPELGIDEDVAQKMRDELLFEQYGGRVAADAEGEAPTDSEDPKETGLPPPSHSYAVEAFERARRHLGIVDNWADQATRAVARGTGEFEREFLQRDGKLLIEAFKRQAERDGKIGPAEAIGARLAAEELELRLKHFREA